MGGRNTNVEIVGFVGPVPTSGQLPNTSTDESGARASLMLVVIAAFAAAASLRVAVKRHAL